MKEFVPPYYNMFKCIAGKCKHSCCLDWEVDVDDKTFEYYKTVKTDFGKKLINNMYEDQTGAHIMLDDIGRCPFLNSDNLCDIIITLGEDALCCICTDHPRFRNYFSNCVEMGIGMCCEEATRIILSCEKGYKSLSEDELSECTVDEAILLKKRNVVFELLADKNSSFLERIELLCDKFDIDFQEINTYKWEEVLLKLECLDNMWQDVLKNTKNIVVDDAFFENIFWDRIFENLTTYYIYRHFAKSSEDNERLYLAFSVFGYTVIKRICYSHYIRYGSVEFEDIVNYCRMFSSELEYCRENMDELFMEFEFVI